MSEGKPKYTPEQIAQLEKSRTISDTELLKGGAEYVVNKMGEKQNLIISQEQSKDVKEGAGLKAIKIPSYMVGREFPEVREYLQTTYGLDGLTRIPENLDELPEELKDGGEYYFLGSTVYGKFGDTRVPGASWHSNSSSKEDGFWVSKEQGLGRGWPENASIIINRK